MKRLFIATPVVSLAPETEATIARLRQNLRHDDIVWVKDDVRHLTLRFLGATPKQKVPEIREAMQRNFQDFDPFTMNITKIGVFGSKYKPEVLWLGFDNFSDFEALFNKIEPELQNIGYESNRGNFVPHITLGRVKKTISKQKFWCAVDEASSSFVGQKIQITALNLYQSFLNKDGPEYKVLFSSKLDTSNL